MMKKILNCYIVALFVALILFPSMVLAQDSVMPGAGSAEFDCNNHCEGVLDTVDPTTKISPLDQCKQYCGEYEVNDFLIFAVKTASRTLGLVGSLALLAFVAGGVMFLASGGNKTLVDRGKATIIGAVIGLLIVFASYTIISFAADALGVTPTDSSKSIFQTSWFE